MRPKASWAIDSESIWCFYPSISCYININLIISFCLLSQSITKWDSHIHQHTFYYTNALFFGRMRCVSPVVSMFQCLCQVLQMYNVHVGLIFAPLLSLVFDSSQERHLQVPPKLVSLCVKFKRSPNQQSALYNMAMATVVLLKTSVRKEKKHYCILTAILLLL